MTRAKTAPSGGLADELPEVFERFGRIDVRRMFGGYGLFHEDRMFGLVAGGRVLLGGDPGYVVYLPLLVFNTAMGVAYLFTGVRAWFDADGPRPSFTP